MECFHKDVGCTCNLIEYVECDNDEDYNPSYDGNFMVDGDGTCVCNCDKDYKNCPSFESDE